MSGTLYRVPRADQRAAFVARLDLYGGRYAGFSEDDRELAATVPLPHLWVFHELTLSVWCRTCSTDSRSCTGNRDQARAALAARETPYCPQRDCNGVLEAAEHTAPGYAGLYYEHCPDCGWRSEP